MKCTLDSDMPTALAISQTVSLPSLSMISLTFETLFRSVVFTAHPDFAASLTLCQCEIYFHLRTVS